MGGRLKGLVSSESVCSHVPQGSVLSSVQSWTGKKLTHYLLLQQILEKENTGVIYILIPTASLVYFHIHSFDHQCFLPNS